MLFGISPLGWVHTVGSLPAVPAAFYMFARHGRIVPRSKVGALYFVTMVIGAISIFPIAHMPAADVIAALTLLVIGGGYGIGLTTFLGRATKYIEVICLSFSAVLLMIPTVSEILHRVPNRHPLVPDLNSPVLKAVRIGFLLTLVIGVTAQVIYIRRKVRSAG